MFAINNFDEQASYISIDLCMFIPRVHNKNHTHLPHPSPELLYNKFHRFTVHFDSLSFFHTNSCTFTYNYVLVF
jgi:hypothetical protein